MIKELMLSYFCHSVCCLCFKLNTNKYYYSLISKYTNNFKFLMGGKESKLKERFLFAIVANKEGDVANFLKVTTILP